MNKDLVKSYVIVDGFLLILGGWIIYYSFSLKYYTSLGPGPGFFPLWIGVLLSALGILSGVINIYVLMRYRDETRNTSSERLFGMSRFKNAGVVTGALIGCTILLRWLGFMLAIGFFSFFLLQIVGRWGWRKSIVLSVIVSVGLFVLFRLYLKIPLPVGPFGF
jgi:putative tricarboxylic transport membrane protein